jgi:hypothetical protein
MNIEFKGTQGDWEYARENQIVFSKKTQHALAVIGEDAPRPSYKKDILDSEIDANGALIAAAPDLLKSLIDLVFTATSLWNQVKPIKDTEFMTVTHPTIEDAKRAIESAFKINRP